MAEKYLASYRVVFNAEDGLQAKIIADHLQDLVADELDEDDEAIDLTQLIPLGEPRTNLEAANTLRAARNVLLRTKKQDAYDMARMLDQMAHVIAERSEEMSGMVHPTYDFGKFTDIAAKIWAGEFPIE